MKINKYFMIGIDVMITDLLVYRERKMIIRKVGL